MEEKHTIGEVALGFGKERKTIERWMAKDGITPEKDTHDERRNLLTKAQVTMLGKNHRITFKPERLTRQEGMTPRKSDVPGEELTTQLTNLEARLRAYIDAQLAALEQRLRESVPPRPMPPPSLPTAKRHHPRAARTPPAPTTSMSGSGLPPGLELWRDYARRHGLSPSTVQTARDRGELRMTKGQWKMENHWMKEALDTKGQHKFWELWGNRPDLHRCEVAGCLCQEHLP